jgi:hypothetical protein
MLHAPEKPVHLDAVAGVDRQLSPAKGADLLLSSG